MPIPTVQLDRHLAGNHLLLCLRIESDVTGDGLTDQTGVDELSNSESRLSRVVGDDGKVALALTDEFIRQPFGCADAHEATDHQDGAVRNHRDVTLMQINTIESEGKQDVKLASGCHVVGISKRANQLERAVRSSQKCGDAERAHRVPEGLWRMDRRHRDR